MGILNKLINKKTFEVNWEIVFSIKEFAVLKETHQNPKWHKEDLVSIHTIRVVNAMLELTNFYVDKDKRFILVAAALFHDVGKGVVTKWNNEKGTWESKNHASEGEKITRRLLWDENFEIREKICTLVSNHMKPLHIYDNNEDVNLIQLSLENVTVNDQILLKQADCMGAMQSEYDGWREKLNHLVYRACQLKCLNKPYDFKNVNEKIFFIKNKRLPVSGENVPIFDFKVYVMVGISGSGKSTYINKNLKGLPVVSRDVIRHDIGLTGKNNGNAKEEEKVTKIFNEQLIKFAEEKRDFVIDNMNLYRRWRNDYKEKLKDYSVWYEYVYIESPSIETNILRRNDMISKEVILKQQKCMEFPRAYEYCRLNIMKQKRSFIKNFWDNIFNFLKK